VTVPKKKKNRKQTHHKMRKKTALDQNVKVDSVVAVKDINAMNHFYFVIHLIGFSDV